MAEFWIMPQWIAYLMFLLGAGMAILGQRWMRDSARKLDEAIAYWERTESLLDVERRRMESNDG